jgi:hypothetical protein
VAIKYGFFNSVNGDRKYTAADIGDYLRGIIYSGVYPDGTSSLQVLAAGGMAVEVQPGRAMLEFKYLENDMPHQITLAAGGTMDRIDAIVAYMDLNERACGIVAKEGTPAAAPVAPAMTRTDVRYEVMLASVYVTRLVNEVTQANITDTRHLTEVCGWVRGAIRQNTADIPVPAPATAGYIPHVTEDGNGYELLAADTTLAIAGRAADAAATGKALEKKAPAGHGLGETEPSTINSLDDINSPGWYKTWFAPADTPAGAQNGTWCISVENFYNSDNFDVIRWTAIPGDDYKMHTLRKVKRVGEWYPWEWDNPPMILGVEYRTTERYNGQPVYTMLFNTGELANGGAFTYASEPVNVCRYAASIDSSALPIHAIATWGGGWSLWCDVTGQKVTAFMGANRTTAAIDVQVWYTKY